MKRYIKILLLSLLCLIAYPQEPDYGLEFSSFEVTQEKRTSLNLTPEKPFVFEEGFMLSFDLYYPSIDQLNYGYVFRLIGQNGQHIDFLTNVEKLQIVNSGGELLASCLREEIPDNSSFFAFSLSLNIQENSLQISIADKTFNPKITDLKDFRKVNLIFGKSDYSNLQTSDVPRMTLKNIKINDGKGKNVYFWKLFKHTENGLVYDELREIPAKTENPKWLIDEHAFWKKRVSLQTGINPQITFDANNYLVAIADRSTFKIYDTETHSVSKRLNTEGLLHSNESNQMIYNQLNSKYYSYCFDSANGKHVAAFDMPGNRWDNSDFREIEIEFWHHNKFVSGKDSSLYVFFGYGHHRYKNVVNRYSFVQKRWETLQLSGDAISPRYLSGLGVVDDDHILVFGGYGSEKGWQEFTPRNYYDLYMIDLRTMTSRKIWELPMQKDNFVVANSLVVDTAEHCFYALCFPQYLFNSHLSLVKFSMEKPEFKTVSDSIPFQFRDVTSYADLYLNKASKELTAVMFHSTIGDTLATVSLFSLAYPPMAVSDIYQSVRAGKSYLLPAAVMAVLLIFSLIFIYCIRFRKKAKKRSFPNREPVTEMPEKKQIKKEQRSEISLFGGFHIKNEAGVDYAGEFSPLLKQLFLIILLHTQKGDSKGISSAKLRDTLWFDKSIENARNNRAVMLTKIRKILENIGDISIESKNSQWSVTFGGEIYCDYMEAMKITERLKHAENDHKHLIIKLTEITSTGELLPDIQTEWIDSFKADFVNNLIDCLLSCSGKYDFSPHEQVAIADVILIHDALNEDAVKLKCTSLVKMRKNGLAKTVYDSFVKEYKKLFGTEYHLSFNEIIS